MNTTKSSQVNKNRGNTIRKLRANLERTQRELGNALGISAKAIQSYEQGWRPVPVRVMIQMLVLLALQKKQNIKPVPCWVIRKCDPAKREKCPSHIMGHGQFCWFLASRTCSPNNSKSKTGILPCMKCPVVLRLLKS